MSSQANTFTTYTSTVPHWTGTTGTSTMTVYINLGEEAFEWSVWKDPRKTLWERISEDKDSLED